jgi:hypothetical protein
MNYILVRILMDGSILTASAGALLLLVFFINPRIALSDYPEDVKAAVPPRTKKELRQGILLSIPALFIVIGIPLVSLWLIKQESGSLPYWLAFVTVFGEWLIFFFFDLLVLDIWLFYGVTPKFMVIPGTEGMAGYKIFKPHLKLHFTLGLPLLAVFAALLGAIPFWVF